MWIQSSYTVVACNESENRGESKNLQYAFWIQAREGNYRVITDYQDNVIVIIFTFCA